MFDKAVEVSEVGSAVPSRNSFGCFARVRSMLKIGLVALLIQSPIYATDPIDFDPDPDTITTIIVQASEEEGSTESLPPGRYMIIVVAEDGSTETQEVHKR